MKNTFELPNANDEQSGIRDRIIRRIPSLPVQPVSPRNQKEKPKENEEVSKDEAYKLTGPAALKLLNLEIRLKKHLQTTQDEASKEEILEKLSQCDDFSGMLARHIDSFAKQEAQIALKNKVPYTENPAVYEKIKLTLKENETPLKLELHPGLRPLLRMIDEFVENNFEKPEHLSRAA